MSKTIALLSGKGGSGKTTLSLSVASMLSNCGIKVLLIDCDLSTNGATYFYEEKLAEAAESVCSFYDLLSNKYNQLGTIHINDNYDFIPSIKRISKDTLKTFAYLEGDESRWKIIKQKLSVMYDVILLDCQAGYTDLLKVLLPSIDISLVVLETDAISSSAIRSLYLKIGSLIDEKKTYQVFNKVSSDEYENYSKLAGGTFFLNIETVLFEWKIRKAFAMAQIPDMEHASASYGAQILNICKMLVTDTASQQKLKKASTEIALAKRKEEKSRTEKKILQAKKEQKENRGSLFRKVYMIILPTFLLLSLLVFWILIEQKDRSFTNQSETISSILALIVALGTLATSSFSLLDFLKDRKNRNKEIDMYMSDLHEIDDSISELESFLNEIPVKKHRSSIERKKTQRSKEG